MMMIKAMRNDNSSLLDINLIDLACKKADSAQHLTSRIHNRCEIEIAGRYFMQHGCKQEKVFAIDEGDLDGRIPGEFSFQLHGNREPGKPASQNKYPFARCILHVLSRRAVY